MKTQRLLRAFLVVFAVVLVIIAGAEAKKRNKKRPPDSPSRLKDEPRKESDISDGGSRDAPQPPDVPQLPAQDSESTTAVASKDVPVADPAVAPEVEASSSGKQKRKHRNRGGKQHRDQPETGDEAEDASLDTTTAKEHKDKAMRKKERIEKRKHHKKHNRHDSITTTTAMMGKDELDAESEPMSTHSPVEPVVNGDPLGEPEVDIDDVVEAMITTTTTIPTKEHHRDREGKRMRDEAKSEREARKEKKERRKMEKQEKRKHRKQNSEPAEESELTVNPTPSPVADGIKLTPSGPSPLQTTQQQSTQTEPETHIKEKKEKRKKKKQMTAEEVEMSKTEKRIQRLERKMHRMGHKRKNATRIPCEDHEDCQNGQCCLLRRGKKVCHIVNKPEGHHCVHPCMCGQGLTCMGKNKKQKSLSKGRCQRVDLTDLAEGGAVVTNNAPTTANNELPQ